MNCACAYTPPAAESQIVSRRTREPSPRWGVGWCRPICGPFPRELRTPRETQDLDPWKGNVEEWKARFIAARQVNSDCCKDQVGEVLALKGHWLGGPCANAACAEGLISKPFPRTHLPPWLHLGRGGWGWRHRHPPPKPPPCGVWWGLVGTKKLVFLRVFRLFWKSDSEFLVHFGIR